MAASEAASVMGRDILATVRLGQIIEPEVEAGGKGYRAGYSFRNLIEMRVAEEMIKFGVPRKRIMSYLKIIKNALTSWMKDDGWIVIDDTWEWQLTSDFSAIALGWKKREPTALLAIRVGKIKQELEDNLQQRSKI